MTVCPKCGGEMEERKDFYLKFETKNVLDRIYKYVCKKCGYVELYLTERREPSID